MSANVPANRSRSDRPVLDSVTPPHGQLLAIRQQAVRIATHRGVLDAQVVKILRIEHRPLPAHQSGNVAPRTLPPQRALPQRALPQRTLPQHARPEVGLRTVGEVLTDYDGHLFEVRDQQLHELGELVRDSRGRLFEVCQQENRKPVAVCATPVSTVGARPTEHRPSFLMRLALAIKNWLRSGKSH